MNSPTLLQKYPLLQAGRKVAADSCSLMYLNRLGVLALYCELHEIVLTRAVYRELVAGTPKRNLYDDINIYKTLFYDTLLDINEDAASGDIQSGRMLSVADVSLIQASVAGYVQGIVTDDKSICRYCRDHDIHHLNAPMVLLALLVQQRLTPAGYQRHMKELYRMGRYGRFVCDFMAERYDEYGREMNNVR